VKRQYTDAVLLGGVDCGGRTARLDHQGLGVDVRHVEIKLIGAIGGIEWCRRRARGDRYERRCLRRAIRQDDRDTVVAADAELVERGDRTRNE
jgi:hypothetical protein